MASSVSPAVLLCFQRKASANADSAKRRTSMSIDKAESLIISGLFTSAAREAQNVLEAPDPKSDVKLRAAYVLLQSLYELNRLSDAQPVITAAYANTSAPLSLAILWASLALEEGSTAGAAEDALRTALEAAAAESPAATSSGDEGDVGAEDLAKGVRLYACDMLASGHGGAHAAEEWLDCYYGTADQRDDAVLRQRDGSPLTAWQAFVSDTAMRQALYKELDRRRPTAGRADSSAETADSTGRSSAAAPHAGGQQAETAARPPAGGQDAAGREPTAPDAAHAVQAGSANSPSGRPPAVHWWDQPPADQGKSSVLNLSAAELTALAIGSAIFLYAAFSERRSINRGLSRSFEVVGGSVGELFKLATTLRPNPMSAAGAPPTLRR